MLTRNDQLESTSPIKKRVLVAVLNWGLGHATRSIPIVQALENMGVEVFLASDGAAMQLLQAEFPQFKCIELPSYRISYASQHMVRNIFWQLPRIFYTYHAEHQHTRAIVQQHRIQGVISDNRYGCFSKQTQNILLTHQLNLRVPYGLLQHLANRLLRRVIAKYDAVWVPDAAREPTLAGALAHPPSGYPPTTYLGLISRFVPASGPINHHYDVAVVLSGPEPQRAVFEQIILAQAKQLPHKFIFIQGIPTNKTQNIVAENIEVLSYLPATELKSLLEACTYVVCRSGYSSLMDLIALGKKAVLVPTPGQTEQEYLATNLPKTGAFVVQQQNTIDLKSALETLAKVGEPSPRGYAMNEFEPVLQQWVKTL